LGDCSKEKKEEREEKDLTHRSRRSRPDQVGVNAVAEEREEERPPGLAAAPDVQRLRKTVCAALAAGRSHIAREQRAGPSNSTTPRGGESEFPDDR